MFGVWKGGCMATDGCNWNRFRNGACENSLHGTHGCLRQSTSQALRWMISGFLICRVKINLLQYHTVRRTSTRSWSCKFNSRNVLSNNWKLINIIKLCVCGSLLPPASILQPPRILFFPSKSTPKKAKILHNLHPLPILGYENTH